jgi:hypothetical protein
VWLPRRGRRQLKRAEIRGEIDLLRATVAQQPAPDLTWCQVQIVDLLAA